MQLTKQSDFLTHHTNFGFTASAFSLFQNPFKVLLITFKALSDPVLEYITELLTPYCPNRLLRSAWLWSSLCSTVSLAMEQPSTQHLIRLQASGFSQQLIDYTTVVISFFCVCLYVYVCMYVCIYVCMCAYAYVCICIIYLLHLSLILL